MKKTKSVKIYSNHTIDFLIKKIQSKSSNLKFEKSNFGQADHEALFFKDIYHSTIYITDFIQFFNKFASCEVDQIEFFLNDYFKTIKKCLQNLSQHSETVYCVLLTPSLFPLDDIIIYKGFDSFEIMNKLNNMLINCMNEIKNLSCIDINKIASRIGCNQFYDYQNWVHYRCPYSALGMNRIAEHFLENLFSNSKSIKIVITDLDNTYWSGVVGDIGIDGIEIGYEVTNGVAHFDYQVFLSRLKNLGLLLAICSKNEKSLAYPALNESRNFLKFKDFIKIECNWERKSHNIKKICSELNIGEESVIFIDDSNYEIDEVSLNSSVKANILYSNEDLKFSSAETLMRAVNFFPKNFTNEDHKKLQMYKENDQREDEAKSYDNIEEFLISQKLRAKFNDLNSDNIIRAMQLIEKTNQFTLSDKTFDKTELLNYYKTNAGFVKVIELEDKHGSYGIISVIIGNISDRILINQWVISCRAFNRSLEAFILRTLAVESGLSTIEVSFKHLEKNMYAKKILSKLFDIENDIKFESFKMKSLDNLHTFVEKIK